MTTTMVATLWHRRRHEQFWPLRLMAKTSAARVKFDLDPSGAAQDDLPLGLAYAYRNGIGKPRAWCLTIAQPNCWKRAPPLYPARTFCAAPPVASARSWRYCALCAAPARPDPGRGTHDLDAWVQWQTEALASPRHDGEAPSHAAGNGRRAQPVVACCNRPVPCPPMLGPATTNASSM